MNNLNEWLKLVVDNGIVSRNKVISYQTSLCFNFLQIPKTDTVIFTVSVMENRVRTRALSRHEFTGMMNIIERSLLEVQENSLDGYCNQYYYISMKPIIPDTWYRKLRCHRVFFIPSNQVWNTIERVFNYNNIEDLTTDFGIKEFSVFVDTMDYDCNLRFKMPLMKGRTENEDKNESNKA